MTRPNVGVTGQVEQNLGDAAVQVGAAARLKVGAATAVDEQCVASEDVPCLRCAVVALCALPHVAHAARRVARGVQRTNLLAAKAQCVSVFELNRSRGDAAAIRRCGFGTRVFR